MIDSIWVGTLNTWRKLLNHSQRLFFPVIITWWHSNDKNAKFSSDSKIIPNADRQCSQNKRILFRIYKRLWYSSLLKTPGCNLNGNAYIIKKTHHKINANVVRAPDRSAACMPCNASIYHVLKHHKLLVHFRKLIPFADQVYVMKFKPAHVIHQSNSS